MKTQFLSILRFAIIATIAGSLSVIGTVRAQQEDTGIGSNPHLRAKSAPTPSSGTATVKLSQKDASFIQKAGGGGQQSGGSRGCEIDRCITGQQVAAAAHGAG